MRMFPISQNPAHWTLRFTTQVFLAFLSNVINWHAAWSDETKVVLTSPKSATNLIVFKDVLINDAIAARKQTNKIKDVLKAIEV